MIGALQAALREPLEGRPRSTSVPPDARGPTLITSSSRSMATMPYRCERTLPGSIFALTDVDECVGPRIGPLTHHRLVLADVTRKC